MQAISPYRMVFLSASLLLLSSCGQGTVFQGITDPSNNKTSDETPKPINNTSPTQSLAPEFIEAENPTFFGHIAQDADGLRVLSWTGTGVQIQFTGPSVDLEIGYRSNAFQPNANSAIVEVFVDSLANNPNRYLVNNKILQVITFSTNDPSPEKVHTLWLVKSSDPQYGDVIFGSINLKDADKQLKNKVPKRKLLFIGDSITVGYGNLSNNINECGSGNNFAMIDNYSSTSFSYAWRLATATSADVRIASLSGRGLWRNRGEIEPANQAGRETMPLLWNRITPAEATSAKIDLTWQPDAIVILLGTNDWWDVNAGQPNPVPTATFAQAVQAFAQQLRQSYPASKILFATGPMVSNAGRGGRKPLDEWNQAIQQGIANLDGVTQVEFGAQTGAPENTFGCLYHPTARVHRLMALHLLNGQEPTAPYLILTKPWTGLRKLLNW